MIKDSDDSVKISVITVTYNAVETIEQAIKSVLEQDYDNVEYIIIDGASDDGTVDIIRRYESNISYWVSEPDHGIYEAMNKGVTHATGDLIGFLSGNDRYDQGALKAVAQKYIETSADVIYGDVTVIDEDQMIRKDYSRVDLGEFNYIMPIIHPGLFVRTEIQKKYGFDESYRSAADAKFYMQVYRSGASFVYCGANIAFYGLDGISANPMVGPRETLRASREVLGEDFSGYSKRAYEFYYYLMFKGLIKKPQFMEIYREIVQNILGNETFIFGAGAKLSEAIRYLRYADIHIAGIIDSDPDKAGKKYDELQIYPVEHIRELEDASVFISSTRYDEEMMVKAQEMISSDNVRARTFLDLFGEVVTEYLVRNGMEDMLAEQI